MPVQQIEDWREAVEAAAAGEFGRILVLGPIDAGKSSFVHESLSFSDFLADRYKPGKY